MYQISFINHLNSVIIWSECVILLPIVKRILVCNAFMSNIRLLQVFHLDLNGIIFKHNYFIIYLLFILNCNYNIDITFYFKFNVDYKIY